jgi:hypothetical protein
VLLVLCWGLAFFAQFEVYGTGMVVMIGASALLVLMLNVAPPDCVAV